MDFEKELNNKVVEIKDDEYWKNNYINIQMWKMDAIIEGEERGKTVGMEAGIKQGMEEGLKKGRTLQKNEDEKIIAQKDAEIAHLKELLAAKK